jgi:hypothetical protein
MPEQGGGRAKRFRCAIYDPRVLGRSAQAVRSGAPAVLFLFGFRRRGNI